jgi:hypothetical protein
VTNIVTLEQAKTYLQIPNPSSASEWDTVIQWLINAADLVIQYECDDILPTLWDEHYDGGNYSIHLRHRPILSVENVEEGWGWINYELDFAEVNSPAPTTSMFAYSIDSHSNAEISRRSAGNVQIPFMVGDNNIHVVYRTGEQEVPGNVFLAELELVSHWFQNSQLRAVALAGANVGYDAVAGQAFTRDTETGVQNVNIGVPYRILEMIKSHRHGPFFA